MSVEKHDRRRYRLENENVDEKNMSSCEKSRVVVSGSRGLQKTELQDLTARCRYSSPDLTDVSMNVLSLLRSLCLVSTSRISCILSMVLLGCRVPSWPGIG